MKTLASLSVAVLLLTVSANLSAQELVEKAIKSEIKNEKEAIKAERKELHKLEGTAVSELSKDAFVKDFGHIPNVTWSRQTYLDEATFTKNGKQIRSYYDADSKLVGTITSKDFANLPGKAQKEIRTKYKNFTVKQVLYFEDNAGNDTDMMVFDTQFEDVDTYFVELVNSAETVYLQVGTDGEVIPFKKVS